MRSVYLSFSSIVSCLTAGNDDGMKLYEAQSHNRHYIDCHRVLSIL